MSCTITCVLLKKFL